jgi:multimeric flavodoxin WrbA
MKGGGTGMKIVIIDGNADTGNSSYEEYLRRLGVLLGERGDDVTVFTLRDMRIGYCIGCYTCWVKTPGLCVFRDDMPGVLKEYVKSDFVLFASPVVMGFVTCLLKAANERLLPLSHPYLTAVRDRFQHPPRYEKNPSVGLLLWDGGSGDREAVGIIDDIYRSNIVRRHRFTRVMDNNVREVADEINAL